MRKSIRCGLLICSLAGFLPVSAVPQAVRVGARKVRPNTAVSSLAVSASPASVSFQLHSKGVATGSSPVAVTTTWGGTICLLTCTIKLYGYFSNATAALSGGSPVVNIPTSEVLGQVTTGTPTTFTAFTQSAPLGGAGASLLLFTQTFTLIPTGSNRTDALNLEINLASQPQLPAGTYSGTLFIQAQSF
jgi:hypothetical protein